MDVAKSVDGAFWPEEMSYNILSSQFAYQL